jgi:hypothetical protein
LLGASAWIVFENIKAAHLSGTMSRCMIAPSGSTTTVMPMLLLSVFAGGM